MAQDSTTKKHWLDLSDADGQSLDQSESAARGTTSVTTAAQILGISRGLAYQGVRDGSIPAIRVGKRWLVPRAALDALLGK